MKKKSLIIISALICLFFIAKAVFNADSNDKGGAKKYIIQGFAQGTTYAITYIDSSENVNKKQIDSILNVFDKSCSIYNDSSLLSRVNRNDTDTLDANILECLSVAKGIYELSDGQYDVTIKPLIEAYGFVKKEKEGAVNVDSLLQFVGLEKLKIEGEKLVKADPRVQIDLNSIAQGYSVDIISRFFDKTGIKNYIIEVGGELYARGNNLEGNPWRVGVNKPIDGSFDSSDGFQEIIELSGLGLATSGNYRKFYVDEHGNRINHTVNPKTGLSSTHNLLSATILAESAIKADGFATACMVLGTDKAIEILKSDENLYGLLVYSKGDSIKTYISPNLVPKIIKQ